MPNKIPEIPGCALYSCVETSGYTESCWITQYNVRLFYTRPFAKMVQTNLANILAKYYHWLNYERTQTPLCCDPTCLYDTAILPKADSTVTHSLSSTNVPDSAVFCYWMKQKCRGCSTDTATYAIPYHPGILWSTRTPCALSSMLMEEQEPNH